MELFQSNNLSLSHPEFVVIDDPSLSETVANLLYEHYSLDTSELQVARFQGANIASQNFKVTTKNNRYFLKARPASQKDQLAAETDVAAKLVAAGVRAPVVIQSVSAELLSTKADTAWALYEFVEGKYFKGTGNELESAANTFGHLTRVASEILRDDLRTDSNPDVFEELEDSLSDRAIASNPDPTIADICRINRDSIVAHLNEVRRHLPMRDLVALPVHLDYHPLNLLMREERVECVLDLEHLKIYPAVSGVGFAAYKLIRQTMVDRKIRHAELSQPSMVKRWLDTWHSYFPTLPFTPLDLGLGASYRILVLINLILSAQKQGDCRFNYDLEKQIHSLHEINAIFRNA